MLRDASEVTPPPGSAPLWAREESEQLRQELQLGGKNVRIGVVNCAIKFFRRLATDKAGQHAVQSIDISVPAAAPAGQGYATPAWRYDSREKGQNNQAGTVEFDKLLELDIKGVLAQLPKNIWDQWWAGGNELLKVSFEFVGELGVAWEVAHAPDMDMVLWGSVRRLHLHPGASGSMSANFQGVADLLAPATGIKKRGKKPQQARDFLIGGQDDEEFMRRAELRRAQGLEAALAYWPVSPYPAIELNIRVVMKVCHHIGH